MFSTAHKSKGLEFDTVRVGEDFSSEMRYQSLAREGSVSDGVYNTTGPGVCVFIAEETLLRSTTTVGARLGNFLLTENSPEKLFDKANLVKRKLLKREEDWDLLELPSAVVQGGN